MQEGLNIAWTTVETKEVAQQLARQWVECGVAVCVQIEGPIESVYRWEGKMQARLSARRVKMWCRMPRWYRTALP